MAVSEWNGAVSQSTKLSASERLGRGATQKVTEHAMFRHVFAIPELGNRWQEDWKCEPSLGCIVRFCLKNTKQKENGVWMCVPLSSSLPLRQGLSLNPGLIFLASLGAISPSIPPFYHCSSWRWGYSTGRMPDFLYGWLGAGVIGMCECLTYYMGALELQF